MDGVNNIAADWHHIDPKLRAYDKLTGGMVGEIDLPRNITAAPMSYSVRGKQHIVVATGG